MSFLSLDSLTSNYSPYCCCFAMVVMDGLFNIKNLKHIKMLLKNIIMDKKLYICKICYWWSYFYYRSSIGMRENLSSLITFTCPQGNILLSKINFLIFFTNVTFILTNFSYSCFFCFILGSSRRTRHVSKEFIDEIKRYKNYLFAYIK